MKIVTMGAESYPSLLKQIFDPPVQLYTEGSVNVLNRLCVAVVGTRQATAYGEALAFELGRDLAIAGLCVVSGLAFGIDAAAHKGALSVGGLTAAVVAQPLTSIRPAKHLGLAREIVEKGGVLVSEKEPGKPTYPVDYLIRNRIISGLCKAVIVVEAGLQSGARNTAAHALEQNRTVFAIPGRLGDPMSEGCHFLIQESKAALFTSINQVLESLGLTRNPQTLPILKGLEAQIMKWVCEEPKHMAELVQISRSSFAELYEALLSLEMKGFIWRAGDQRYAACKSLTPPKVQTP